MKTYIFLWQYLDEFFLGWEMFQTNVKQIKTHILCSITFFRKSCRLWGNVERYGTARQATDDNIIPRMRFTYWIAKATDTHSEYEILIVFSQQHWLRERASMLGYTFISCLVALKFHVYYFIEETGSIDLQLLDEPCTFWRCFPTYDGIRSEILAICFGILYSSSWTVYGVSHTLLFRVPHKL